MRTRTAAVRRPAAARPARRRVARATARWRSAVAGIAAGLSAASLAGPGSPRQPSPPASATSWPPASSRLSRQLRRLRRRRRRRPRATPPRPCVTPDRCVRRRRRCWLRWASVAELRRWRRLGLAGARPVATRRRRLHRPALRRPVAHSAHSGSRIGHLTAWRTSGVLSCMLGLM